MMSTCTSKKGRKLESLLDQDWKKVKPIDWTLLLENPYPSTVYGLDLSVENPSLTRIRSSDKSVLIVGYRNRVSERNPVHQTFEWLPNGIQKGWTVRVELRERPVISQSLSVYRFNRYDAWIQDLMSYFTDATSSDMIGIEHYAYNALNSHATTLLYELGATIRMALVRRGLSVVELPPTTVKKLFSGDGRADKAGMYKVYCEQKLPDLFHALDLRDSHQYTQVPHPVEDMVDSFAVASTLWWSKCPSAAAVHRKKKSGLEHRSKKVKVEV